MKIPQSWEQWFKTLIAGSISGSCSAILASFGAAAVGKPLDWKQIGAVAGSGAFMSAVMYLKQSPLPDITETKVTTETKKTTETTETINK